jgi:ADP-heptose:LPS heptosyltransferase
VRAARFTHVIDLDNTEGTAVLARISAAPTRVVLRHGTLAVKLPGAYTHPVHDPAERHETHTISEYYLHALEPLGVPVATREITLKPRDSDLVELRRFVGASARVLLVHPGSRSPMRVWPAERFAQVIDHVQDELDAQVILAGGPSDQPIVDAIRQRVRTHLLALPATTTISRFAALARLSHAVLCHDSGPMHVAAAVGTPVVALYGSQNAALFHPEGPRHTVLQPHLPCATCVTPRECDPMDSYRNRCVQNITVERVMEAVRAILAGAPGAGAAGSRSRP